MKRHTIDSKRLSLLVSRKAMKKQPIHDDEDRSSDVESHTIIRGGEFHITTTEDYIRSLYRGSAEPWLEDITIGLRIVRNKR